MTCPGLVCPIDCRPIEHVLLGDQQLEVVESFFYHGDGISPNGDCEANTIARICFAWEKFCQLLPMLTNKTIPPKSRGKVCNSWILSVMFYGSECWAITTADVQRLKQNEHAMIRWICKVKIRDKIFDSLLNKLCLKNLAITPQAHSLCWFGHVCCSDSWLKKYTQHEVVGKWELSEDLTSNHNAQIEALRMTKRPTCKKFGTWAQSG